MPGKQPSTSITYTRAGPLIDEGGRVVSARRGMLAELTDNRELIWQLFWRDFRARYRQSVLGIAWALLLPVATVATFVFMHRSGLLTINDTGLPYPLFALSGLTAWHLFSGGATAGASALTNAGSMIAKINLSRSALIIAAMGQSAAELIIRMLLLAVAFAVYGIVPSLPGMLPALVSLLPLCLLTLGTAFILSLAASIVRDVINGLGIAFSALLLLTPVLYPLPTGSPLETFNRFNPLYYLIDVPRDLFLHGTTDHGIAYIFATLFASLVFLGGWRLFHVAQPYIAERI